VVGTLQIVVHVLRLVTAKNVATSHGPPLASNTVGTSDWTRAESKFLSNAWQVPTPGYIAVPLQVLRTRTDDL
jgi:hypothetical protein